MEILTKRIISELCVVLAATSLHASTGLEDILNSGSSFDFAGPSSLKTQTRSYYNFGGLSVRSDVGGSIRPFNITMPHIASGCGGVDIGFGGFSFLSIDQLVAKLQKIASAAPAFAFNMALSALCKDCQSIMDQLNAVADSINGLNFNACKSAVSWGKSIGNAMNAKLGTQDDAKSGIESVVGDLSGAIKSATSNIQAFINCGPGGECTDQSSAAAKEKALEKMKFQGSLVKKIFTDNSSFLSATTTGSNSSSAYAYWFSGLSQDDAQALFRNMIGDYYGYVDEDSCGGTDSEGGHTNYLVKITAPGMSADEVVDIMLGTDDSNATTNLKGIFLLSEQNACDEKHKGIPEYSDQQDISSAINAQNLRKSVENRLLIILSNMANISDNSIKNDAAFISAFRYPVYKALNVASITQDKLLVSYIAEAIVAEELVGLINELMRKARTMLSLTGQTESTKLFRSEDYKAIEDRIVLINEKAARVKSETLAKMQSRVAQVSVLEDVVKRYKQELSRRGMYRLGH